MAVRMDLYIIQLDVSNAFLYGVLEEEIYTSQPDGYHDGTERVCRLHKSLYGLKQAPRVWYHALESALLAQGFEQSEYDPALYILHTKVHQVLWLIVYVDDILMVSGSLSLLTHIKGMLTKEFVMTDMGEPSYYLGMNIIRDRPSRSLFLSQEQYIHKVLSRFGLLTCNPASTPLPSTFQPSQTEPFSDWDEFHEALAPSSSSSPFSSSAPPSSLLSPLDINLYQSIVGSLMYASVCTRPDLSHAVGVPSQFLSAPSTQHLNAAKGVLRYLSGSKYFGLFFHGHEHGSVLHGFTDADWAGPLSKRKSIGGYMFMIAGAAISWQSKKQGCVALSSTEAEYMAVTQRAREAVWLRGLLTELALPQHEPTILHIDNTSAIALSKNPVYHGRTKHIDTQYHYIRELIKNKVVTPAYCSTTDQAADFLTKILPRHLFLLGRHRAGLLPIESLKCFSTAVPSAPSHSEGQQCGGVLE
ncbi:unnamed protein product [Closterium sp. NIES-54]